MENHREMPVYPAFKIFFGVNTEGELRRIVIYGEGSKNSFKYQVYKETEDHSREEADAVKTFITYEGFCFEAKFVSEFEKEYEAINYISSLLKEISRAS